MNLCPWAVCAHPYEKHSQRCMERLESGRSSSLLAYTSAGLANRNLPQMDTSAKGTPLGGIDPKHRRSGRARQVNHCNTLAHRQGG